MAFDLKRFRDLAFGKRALPDHPVVTEADARSLVESLPLHDPAAALADLTACVLSINENAGFGPGRRARVMMELDVAANRLWRPLGEEFLAPGGVPLAGRDGDPSILRALQESASEFSMGFAVCTQKESMASSWIKANRVAVMLRRAVWLTRKMMLSRMLNLPGADARWTELNSLYRLAARSDLLRNVGHVFPGDSHTSSVKLEYVRMLLVDITRPDRMLGRDMELAYRLIGRVAANARLESEPIPGAQYFVVPRGVQRPVALFRHSGAVPKGALYLHTANILPRLQAMLERDAGLDGGDPDPVFSMLFTVRERRALINFMMNQWGERPAQRRAPRIAMKGQAMLLYGHDALAQVVRPHDQGGFNGDKASASKLRIQFDRSVTVGRTSIREISSEITDASASGLGISLPRAQARWAKIGALVGVLLDPGADWVLGVVRRMNASDDKLELGISVLTRKPTLVWCEISDIGHTSVWEDAKRFEKNFDEHFVKGILLEPQGANLVSGEILFPPGASSRGSVFDLPVKGGEVRLRVITVREETHDFQRVEFEPQGVRS